MLANGAGWQAVKVFLLLKHSWSYAKAKHIRTDMKLLEVTMIYAGKDGTKEELLVLRAHQELWEWNVAAPLSRWFWYVLILSGSDGLSGIATPSVIKLLYITVRTSIYYICIFLYFIIYILVTNSIPHTLGITRMTSKRKGPSAYTGIVCIWCLYIGHYWTWLDFVFVSLFIMYICVCFFCLHLHQWHVTGHDFTLCTNIDIFLDGLFSRLMSPACRWRRKMKSAICLSCVHAAYVATHVLREKVCIEVRSCPLVPWQKRQGSWYWSFGFAALAK